MITPPGRHFSPGHGSRAELQQQQRQQHSVLLCSFLPPHHRQPDSCGLYTHTTDTQTAIHRGHTTLPTTINIYRWNCEIASVIAAGGLLTNSDATQTVRRFPAPGAGSCYPCQDRGHSCPGDLQEKSETSSLRLHGENSLHETQQRSR